MAAKILFVDDDANILSGFQRNLRNRFTVVTADSGDKALKLLNQDSSFAVIVSDFRMPAMTGVEFFSKTAARWPQCVRVLLTGEADTRAAAAAVNQGQIFRFVSKPCPTFTLEKILAEAVKHHELITSEKMLLEKTVRGSIEVMTEILNVLHPIAFSRSNRIFQIASIILRSINVPNKWEFEIAAMLAHIGCITVPLDILEKVWQGDPLSERELSIYSLHPATGSRMLEHIPRLEMVAEIIASQLTLAAALPAWQEIETVDRAALGSHLLKVAIDAEGCISRDFSKPAVLLELRTKGHHPGLLKPLEDALDDLVRTGSRSKMIPTGALECGMILDADVMGEHGLLLMASGQLLSATLIQYLQQQLSSEAAVKVKLPSQEPALIGT